jgi:hypothetical protein
LPAALNRRTLQHRVFRFREERHDETDRTSYLCMASLDDPAVGENDKKQK